MSTEQHESLKLADAIEAGCPYDEGKCVETIRASHALIVQMAEALEWAAKIHKDPTLAQERDPKLWLPSVDEAHAAATQYLKGPKT